MSSTTTNLGLNTWTRADKLLVSEINSNFQTIDALTSIIESGTLTSTYTGGASGTATWRYRKYVGGTYELDTVISTSLQCNTGSAYPYYCTDITLNIPGALTSIYGYKNEMVSSSSNGWVRTKAVNVSSLTFCVNSVASEASANVKDFYISIKGTWS